MIFDVIDIRNMRITPTHIQIDCELSLFFARFDVTLSLPKLSAATKKLGEAIAQHAEG